MFGSSEKNTRKKKGNTNESFLFVLLFLFDNFIDWKLVEIATRKQVVSAGLQQLLFRWRPKETPAIARRNLQFFLIGSVVISIQARKLQLSFLSFRSRK